MTEAEQLQAELRRLYAQSRALWVTVEGKVRLMLAAGRSHADIAKETGLTEGEVDMLDRPTSLH